VIDDLKSIVNENMGQREECAREAHSIIGRGVVEFFESLVTLDIEPMIKQIYQKAYKDAQIEATRVIENGYIPKEYEEQVHKMAQQVLKRFLHDMTYKMRAEASEESKDTITSAMRFMIEKNKG
jgi:glutamyl-tRNA reductase